ncbi:unnamed protein product [marine sediment metagenome]|uniref:Uncharacterized protein n=1 Tax=marine sediment metagenome TaxID=412755 RepID=X1RLA8_9ZZZZ
MPLADLLMERFKVRTRAVENPKAVTKAKDTAQIILSNNPNRLGFVIVNLGAEVCYVGLTREIEAATRGIRLDANGGIVSMIWDEDFDMVAWGWWIIAASGTPAVYCIEIVEY